MPPAFIFPHAGLVLSFNRPARSSIADRTAVVPDSHLRCLPPSTRIVSPVTKSVPTRNNTAFAISASPPQRPSGVDFATDIAFFRRHLRRRKNRSRGDRVHQDLIARQLGGQRFGQRLHAGFGDIVRQVAFVTRAAARDEPVGEIDDAPAALLHVNGRGVRAQERGAQVNRQLPIPVRLGQLRKRLGGVERGHVDQDVEASQLADRGADQATAVVGAGHIALHRDGAPAGGAHRRGGLIGLGARSVVDQRHVSAALARGRPRPPHRSACRR